MAALRRSAVEGLRHHEQRFAAQQRGWCDFLLAFDTDDNAVGHVVVRKSSKYDSVIAHLGLTPEINGLAAYPTGVGTGTALLHAAETVVNARDRSHIGLAVERTNHGARRLYERHGYVEWAHGDVIDEWDELANDGSLIRSHREICDYLVLHLSETGGVHSGELPRCPGVRGQVRAGA